MVILSNHRFHELVTAVETAQSIISEARQVAEVHYNFVSYPDRTMSKAELAAMFGVTTRTFAKLLHPLREQLRQMGVSDKAKLLPPQAVKFVCKELDIVNQRNKNAEKTEKY